MAVRLDRVLQPPGTNKQHPLCPKLKLMVTKISGDYSTSENFRQRALTSYRRQEGNPQGTNTTESSKCGHNFVVKGKFLIFLVENSLRNIQISLL